MSGRRCQRYIYPNVADRAIRKPVLRPEAGAKPMGESARSSQLGVSCCDMTRSARAVLLRVAAIALFELCAPCLELCAAKRCALDLFELCVCGCALQDWAECCCFPRAVLGPYAGARSSCRLEAAAFCSNGPAWEQVPAASGIHYHACDNRQVDRRCARCIHSASQVALLGTCV
jgi:hypothetical protein